MARHQIGERDDPTPEQRASVDGKLDERVAASEKLGRKDWLDLVVRRLLVGDGNPAAESAPRRSLRITDQRPALAPRWSAITSLSPIGLRR